MLFFYIVFITLQTIVIYLVCSLYKVTGNHFCESVNELSGKFMSSLSKVFLSNYFNSFFLNNILAAALILPYYNIMKVI